MLMPTVPGLDLRGESRAAGRVAGPDRRHQAVADVVRDPDRVGQPVLALAHDGHDLILGRKEVLHAHLPGEELPEAGAIASHVAPAEVTTRRIRDHVRTPGRVGDKPDGLRRLHRRAKPPALDARLRLFGRPAFLVNHQRRVEAERAQRLDAEPS